METSRSTAGPLVVSQANPRYFTVALGDGVGRAVYLAGSHIWKGMNLIAMDPRGDLTSTGYALADEGEEYLVLHPNEDPAFTVTVDPGTYSVEWFSVIGRETRARTQ